MGLFKFLKEKFSKKKDEKIENPSEPHQNEENFNLENDNENILNDKNLDEKNAINSIEIDKNDEIYFNHFDNPNSCTVEELQSACEFPSKEFKSLSDFEYREDTLTIICGSFYMINEVVSPDCFL